MIILAGGFGNRLKSIVKDIPKPMASINGRPFLDYLLTYLISYNLNKVILSVYYKHEMIKNYYRSRFQSIDLSYSVDKKPYGTGGAIKKAMEFSKTQNIFIINGDTYFDININKLVKIHIEKDNDITMCLKQMFNFDRYGLVEINNKGMVSLLKDKRYYESGLIDGGIYLIKKSIAGYLPKREKFSFNDFIIENIKNLKIGSMVFEDKFIDIGIPEDYKLAQTVLKNLL